MKVLIITTAFPRWKNDGRASFIYETAQALIRQGHQIRVIAMHNPGSKSFEKLEGIEVIRPRYLPDKMEILQNDGAGLPQAWKSNYWSRLAIIPFFIAHTLATAYWSRGFDIIHANWTLSGLSAWVTKWLHRIPIVVTVHGSDIYRSEDNWFLKCITRFALSRADEVFAVSNDLKKIVDHYDIRREKSLVISNGINLRKFSNSIRSSRESLILFVGSLISRKGVDILLKAFADVNQSIPQFRLAIIGDGVLRTELENMCVDLGIQNKVYFLGYKQPSDVQGWMRKAKLLVLPSVEEGQGVVLLEALASGTPCIGSRIGGIPDVITPEVGRTFTPGNSDELGKAIMDVADTSEWYEMSRKARMRAVNEYNIDTIAGKISSEYHKILRKQI